MRIYQIITIIIIIILDQFTKYIIQSRLLLGNSVEVFGDFFRITYVKNEGIAFGFFNSYGDTFKYFTPAAIVILIFIYYSIKNKNLIYRLSFAMIFGGAISNYLDRIFKGFVVDFIDIDFFTVNIPSFSIWKINFQGYFMDRWPAFNIADSSISVAITILIVYTLFFEKNPE